MPRPRSRVQYRVAATEPPSVRLPQRVVVDGFGGALAPRLAQRMIERALTAGVPVSWVLGDEVYGNDRRLRIWLEQHDRPHVLAVKATEPLWALVAGQGAIQVPARDLAAAEPLEGWRRLSAGAGSRPDSTSAATSAQLCDFAACVSRDWEAEFVRYLRPCIMHAYWQA